MTRDTICPVIDAADDLVELVRAATILMAFDNDGDGPFLALYDDHLLGGTGPIRRAAERLRQALLDHDRAELARGCL
jgi:hypothetical protein